MEEVWGEAGAWLVELLVLESDGLGHRDVVEGSGERWRVYSMQQPLRLDPEIVLYPDVIHRTSVA